MKEIIRNVCVRQAYGRLSTIKKAIMDPGISVVSFDIFDTLLVRPCLEPRDIFFLTTKKAKKLYGADFLKIRFDAEKLSDDVNHNIYDIWDEIAKKNGLDRKDADALLSLEIDAEYRFLYPRKVVMNLYKLAVEKKKKVIAVSDMYLTQDILKSILESKGYDKIENIYVSCECKCRKDTGQLFEYVLKHERIGKEQILHIGDNAFSDYRKPKQMGIKSFWIPSNKALFFSLNQHLRQLNISDPFYRIALGFGINAAFETENTRLDLIKFSKIVLFPLLSRISYFCLNNSSLTENYETILFAARDGYLPYLCYSVLNKKISNSLPCKYIFASRIAYGFGTAGSIYELADKSECDLNSFVLRYINSSQLKERIVAGIAGEKCQLKAKECARDALTEFEPALTEYYDNQVRLSKKYYGSLVPLNSDRIIVFDCGYSGSISIGIQSAIDDKCPVDKIYLWATEWNDELDKRNGTKTYKMLSGNIRDSLLYSTELLLSPYIGTCVGFCSCEGKIEPMFNKMPGLVGMQEDVSVIHDAVKSAVESFCDLMVSYNQFFYIEDSSAYGDILRILFSDSARNVEIFKRIFFVDDFLGQEPRCLSTILLDERNIKNLAYKAIVKLRDKFK